jgi:hypothetical protein
MPVIEDLFHAFKVLGLAWVASVEISAVFFRDVGDFGSKVSWGR